MFGQKASKTHLANMSHAETNSLDLEIQVMTNTALLLANQS
jgi:hypothetical protein